MTKERLAELEAVFLECDPLDPNSYARMRTAGLTLVGEVSFLQGRIKPKPVLVEDRSKMTPMERYHASCSPLTYTEWLIEQGTLPSLSTPMVDRKSVTAPEANVKLPSTSPYKD